MSFNLSWRHFHLIVRYICISLSLCSCIVHAAGPTNAIGKKNRAAFTIFESIPLDSSTPTFSLLGGAVGYSGRGLEIQPDSTENANSASLIAGIPAMPYVSASKTKDEITTQATAFLQPYVNYIGTSLKTWMAANGYKASSFVYQQELTPRGAGRTMKLIWQVSITDGGRLIYGAPRVIDSDPSYVYITYTSLQATQGLPSTWKYTDAGLMKWQIRRKDGTPVTSWVTINTNGAFDTPESGDTNAGLNCIVNKNSSSACITSYVDAKQLIADSNSNGAIIDYVRQLQPLYDTTIDTATGNTVQSPRMSFAINTRTLTPSDCSHAQYRNAGTYGFTLQSTVDRYTLREGENAAQLAQRFNTTSLSPTQPFDLTQNTSLHSNDLQGLVINPFDSNGALISTATLPSSTYVSPLSLNDSNLGNVAVLGYGQGGGRGYTGESINVSSYMSGNTFVLSMSTPWIEGYDDGRVIRDTYIQLNIPLCRIESAVITSSGAVQGQVIFVNGTAVSATDGVGFQTSLWDPDAPGGCDDYGCSTGGPLVVWNQPMVQYVTQPFSWGQLLRNSNAYWHSNSYVPIDFKSKLVNGTNTFLFQHLTFHGSVSAAELRITVAPY
jgi:hypothetical protein